MPEPQPFRFLDLSAELRDIIYRLLLKCPRGGVWIRADGSDPPYMAHWDTPRQNVALLQVNQQVHSEATPVLYRNKFKYEDDQCCGKFLKQIRDSTKLLRKIQISRCNKSSIRRSLVLLKQATHLDRLEIAYESAPWLPDAARMAKEIGPWFRAFHKMRKTNVTDNHDSALNVLDFFLPAYALSMWDDIVRAERLATVARYSAEVKAALLKTLKD